MADDIEMDNFDLFGLSNTILRKIFKHLNDTDLLNSTKVCKRFKTISLEAFAEKYSDESEDGYYTVAVLTGDSTEEPRPYWPIFNTFGEKMSALCVVFKSASKVSQKHWLIRTIDQKCPVLTRLKITRNVEEHFISLKGFSRIFSTLTHLTLYDLTMKNSDWARVTFPTLRKFQAIGVKGFNQTDFDQFIANNTQLEELSLVRCEGFQLNVLQRMSNRMTELKSLELDTADGVISGDTINLDCLESLKIAVGHKTIIDILKAVANGCKQLHSLKVDAVRFDYKLNILRGDVIDVICSFDHLKKLDILGADLKIDLIIILMSRLPQLVSLHIHRANASFELSGDNVLSLFSMGPNLMEFLVHIQSFEKSKRLTFNVDFCDRFVEIVGDRDAKFIIDQGVRIVVSKETIRCGDTAAIQHALVNGTWKMAKHDAKNVSETLFRFDMDNLTQAENTLRQCGDKISRASISWRSFGDENAKKEFWNRMMKICGGKLIELYLEKMQLHSMRAYNLSFPNLSKLELAEFDCNVIADFSVFNCPKLTHLELYQYRIWSEHVTREQIVEANLFKNLISIKLDEVDQCMKQVFNLMSDIICNSIEEFTIGGYEDMDRSNLVKHMMIINTIARFRNLTTLNKIVAYIEYVNFKHLFENCTKLTKLSLSFEADYDFDRCKSMFECVQKNCKKIQRIQLVQRAFSTDSAGNDFDDVEEYHEDFLKMVYDLFPSAIIDIVAIGQNSECYWEKRLTDTWRKMVRRPL